MNLFKNIQIQRAFHLQITILVCQWVPVGRWFSPGIPVSSTYKTDRHDITQILLKVALSVVITSSLTLKNLENMNELSTQHKKIGNKNHLCTNMIIEIWWRLSLQQYWEINMIHTQTLENLNKYHLCTHIMKIRVNSIRVYLKSFKHSQKLTKTFTKAYLYFFFTFPLPVSVDSAFKFIGRIRADLRSCWAQCCSL